MDKVTIVIEMDGHKYTLGLKEVTDLGLRTLYKIMLRTYQRAKLRHNALNQAEEIINED